MMLLADSNMKNREIITLDNTSVNQLYRFKTNVWDPPEECLCWGRRTFILCVKKKMKFLFNPQIKKEKNLTCAVPKIKIPTVNFQLNRTHWNSQLCWCRVVEMQSSWHCWKCCRGKRSHCLCHSGYRVLHILLWSRGTSSWRERRQGQGPVKDMVN